MIFRLCIFRNTPKSNDIFKQSWSKSNQGIYSLSDKTSYRQISWSLEAARLDVAMVVSLWNLAGTSAAERLEKFKPESRSFETSRDLAVRRLTAQWIEALQIPTLAQPRLQSQPHLLVPVVSNIVGVVTLPRYRIFGITLFMQHKIYWLT